MPMPADERLKVEGSTLDLYCTVHPLEVLRPHLDKAGIITARGLSKVRDRARVRVSGVLVMVHTPPTRSGRRVMFVTLEDETGLVDLVVFPQVQERWAREIFTWEVLTVEGRVKKEGAGEQSVTVVVERVLPSLCSSSLGDIS